MNWDGCLSRKKIYYSLICSDVIVLVVGVIILNIRLMNLSMFEGFCGGRFYWLKYRFIKCFVRW